MSTTHLGWHDGWLCVIYACPLWSEPTLVRHYWPVVRMSLADATAIYRLGEPCRDGGSGLGYFTQPRVVGVGVHELRLRDGGSTQPIHTTQTPIPAPRTRVQTRYLRGAWQKYLRSRGWVAA